MWQAVGVIVVILLTSMVLPLAAAHVGWESGAAFLLPVIGIAAALWFFASGPAANE